MTSYITFTDGLLDTAANPTLDYPPDEPADSDVEDLAATPNELASFAAAATVDLTAPVVLTRETADLAAPVVLTTRDRRPRQ